MRIAWILAIVFFMSIAPRAIAQPVTADLELVSFSVSPLVTTSNSTVNVSFTVRNAGPGRGQLLRVEILVNGSVQAQGGQLLVLSAPGDTIPFNGTADMPTVSAGSSVSATVTARLFEVNSGVSTSNNQASRIVTVEGPARPDITFNPSPPGWQSPGPIVVSTSTGTTTHAATIPFGIPAFVDIAWRNIGGSMPTTGGGVQVELFVDGVELLDTPYAPMASGQQLTRLDMQIPQGMLTPGSHTVRLQLDGGGFINEGEENNNVFNLTFVVSPPPQPNLAFDPPTGRIPVAFIVSNQSNASSSAVSMMQGDTAYVSVQYFNIGTAAAGAFNLQLRMNGQAVGSFRDPGLAISQSVTRVDLFTIPNIPSGNVQFSITLDSSAEVAESNESDNARSLTIPVSAIVCPSVATPPTTQSTCRTGSAAFSITAAGTGPFTYQWERETLPGSNAFVSLENGPSTLWDSDAPGAGAQVSGVTTNTLSISADSANGKHLAATHARQFRCRVSAATCASAFSPPAQLYICTADVQCSDGVSADDIFSFLDSWFAQNGNTSGNFSADFNHDGTVSADDIFAYLDAWFIQNGNCP